MSRIGGILPTPEPDLKIEANESIGTAPADSLVSPTDSDEVFNDELIRLDPASKYRYQSSISLIALNKVSSGT